MVELSLEKGVSYDLRHRVKNQYGWSDYSDVYTFIASDVPSEPLKPTLLTVD